ncbi:hypothetical protein AALP_AA7G273700 [Arabis alpina]|uniref:Pentatricopeptide repeat-containing protein n=1 Tax=Arabis alpina TaxID=50452 RepID=A0A087GKX2_ARAAL|nr:hypothetical protein AALP_AA7G273700 [Arabis alpina]
MRRSHGSLRKVQETIRFYSSSSSCSASSLLEFVNVDFPSTLGNRGRREFTRLLKLRESNDHNVVHGQIIVSGFESDTYLSNVLMNSYSKAGVFGYVRDIDYARLVFDALPEKSTVTWTTMISGCVKMGRSYVALELFYQLMEGNIVPDGYILSAVLSACSILSFIEGGKQIHAHILRHGHEMDASLINVLIDSYVKCGKVRSGRKLFDGMWNKNIISWTTIVSGYKENSLHKEAMELFSGMSNFGLKPDVYACSSILTSCASLHALEYGRHVHAYIIKANLGNDSYVTNSLIDMLLKTRDTIALIDVYSNCYCLKDSRLVFDEVKEKDLVVWNSMFSAAGNLASLQLGQEFHCQLMKRGLERNPYITNALLDMYAKCGSPEDAHKAFDSAASRDVVCWNSVISSYANHGEGKKALQMLERMMNEGIEPNYITFVGVLSACRAGRLNEARELIEKMPFKPPAIVWRSLLSGCAKTSNIELAEHAAEMAISLDPTDSGSFTLLSNIYASKGMWTDAKKVRERMKSDGVVKEPGRSWIEIDKKIKGVT